MGALGSSGELWGALGSSGGGNSVGALGGLGELWGALLSSLGRLPQDSVLTPPRAPFTSPQGSRDPPDLGILRSCGSGGSGDPQVLGILGIWEIWGSRGFWRSGEGGGRFLGSTPPGLGWALSPYEPTSGFHNWTRGTIRGSQVALAMLRSRSLGFAVLSLSPCGPSSLAFTTGLAEQFAVVRSPSRGGSLGD